MARSVGIDVGGTKCLGVALDDDHTVISVERQPTPADPNNLVAALTDLIDLLGPADHVGLGLPGWVDTDGVLRASPHLGAAVGYDIAGAVAERCGLPAIAVNDATGATLAEWRIGAGHGVDNLVMVTLGTGIGGGLVADGHLIRGRHGWAGEFGHMVVHQDGLPCPCGRQGCWERYASGTGLAAAARRSVRTGDRMLDLACGDPAAITGEIVVAAALEGDAHAIEIIDELSRWIALGLVNLTNALDPELFVLGGGAMEGLTSYLGVIEQGFVELLAPPRDQPAPRIVIAQHGERAGAVGAALLHTLWPG
ncbi:MAG: glucokinase [Ilumatobacter coccineus]|uniref:Glucokinase n=1 Tax=Ilumatobacter coccineus TaxID=467094 RepID=A0A2G6K9M8_9ACTN|nr:MAG: glucokinase [Ilumatobacter coccineus]